MVFRLPDAGPVRVRTSITPAEAPTVNELEEGELSLNSSDGVLYFQTAADSVSQVPSSTGIKNIVSISQSAYDALTPVSTTLYIVTPDPE